MSFAHSNDISVYLLSNSLKICGFWMETSYNKQLCRNAVLVCSISGIIAILFAMGVDAYHSLGDIDECLYIASNILTGSFGLLKISLLLWHRKRFFDLVDHLQQKFLSSSYDDYEKTILRNCKCVSLFFVCCFTGFAHGTIVNYILDPTITNIGKNDTDRTLPFKLWTDWATVSPYFEISFVLEIIFMYQCALYYISFDCFLFILNMHIAGQFRILQYRFTTINGVSNKEKSGKSASRKCYTTFKDCVRQHQILIAYCKKLNSVFNLFALIQVVLFSILICFVGYEILMADVPTARRFIFICHIGGSLSQLFMFSYGCDCLIQESADIATAIYSAPWTHLSMNENGKMLRKDSIIVIMKSGTPCKLSACGFSSISLETYTTVLSTAMSYFALLKQSTEE